MRRTAEDFCRRMLQKGDGGGEKNRGWRFVSCRSCCLFALEASLFAPWRQDKIRLYYIDGAQNTKECMQNERFERLFLHRMQVFLKKNQSGGKKTSDTFMRKRFPLRMSARAGRKWQGGK